MIVQQTFNSQNGKFSYLEWGGCGPILHIAHATGFCAGLYTPLANILTSRLKVVGMDYRGHGNSKAVANHKKLTNWDVFSDDLGVFFDYLQEPVIAVGHSLGAVTSMMLAANRPELFKALILIDPTIMPQYINLVLYLAQKLYLTKIFPIISGAAKRNRLWPDSDTVLDIYSKKLPFRNWSPGFLEAYIQYGFEDIVTGGTKLRCEPEWESKCFSTCPAGIWKKPRLLTMPVLVIYGAKSDVFTNRCARKFRLEVPHSEIHCIPKATHFVPMEKPLETAKLIFDFLMRNQIIDPQ